MKILLLNQAFYPDVVSTAQHLSDLATELAKESVRARMEDRVIALLKVFTRPRKLLAGVRAVGDPVAVLPVREAWSRQAPTPRCPWALGSSCGPSTRTTLLDPTVSMCSLEAKHLDPTSAKHNSTRARPSRRARSPSGKASEIPARRSRGRSSSVEQQASDTTGSGFGRGLYLFSGLSWRPHSSFRLTMSLIGPEPTYRDVRLESVIRD